MNEQILQISARIRELREACGYTQQELADKLGIEIGVMRGYEENGYNIPISVIYQIATICGVEFTEILTGNDPRLDTYQVVKKGQTGGSADRCNAGKRANSCSSAQHRHESTAGNQLFHR